MNSIKYMMQTLGPTTPSHKNNLKFAFYDTLQDLQFHPEESSSAIFEIFLVFLS